MAGVTGWTVNGTDLRTTAYDFNTRWGWDSSASLRGGPIPIAYRDGATMRDTMLQAAVLGFNITVYGVNPATGVADSGLSRWEWLDENLDTLRGVFDVAELNITRTMPSGDTREYHGCYALSGMEVRERVSGIMECFIPVTVPEGSARDTTTGQNTQTETNLTGASSFNVTVGGNVRTRPTITITADNAVTNATLSTGGHTIGVTGLTTGQVAIIDCTNRTITIDGAFGDSSIIRNGARWFELTDGGVNVVTYSITSGQVDVTLDWYDRWR